VDVALLLCGLAVGVLVCTEVARRIDFPAPFLLIAVGVAASYIPQVPQVYLDHDVVLLGLLPPLLYAAAQQTSLVDFRANWRPILMLSVGLVIFTTVGVAVVLRMLVPDLPWAVALAVGAVVAPPDAVAATAIGRRIGLPRRVVTILEGESLLNDATALVTLRTALAVAAGTGFDAAHVAEDFVIAAGGGALIGFAFFYVVAKVRRLIADPVTDSAMSLVVPFAAYVGAEEVHASGVIAVVVAGLLLGHKAPVLQSAQSRIAERLNWRTIAFVLENAVFLLIGLQAWWIVEGAADSDLGAGRIVALCAGVLAAVIVLRLAWVFPTRMLYVRRVERDTGVRPPWTFTFLIGWAGMRGVVTLAAAFVIPSSVPYHEVLLLVAFSVVAGTLFLQGMTLPWMARRLRVPSPDPAEDALARATLLQQASKAALHHLDSEVSYDDRHGVVDLIRQRLDQRNFAAWERLATVEDQEAPSELYNRVRQELIGVERRRVLEIRSSGTVPADVVADVLAMLDVEESMLDVAAEERREVRSAAPSPRTGATCADLDHHGAIETVENPVCNRCLEEGLHWVALRQCLTCGNVACCDSSPGQHATAHFHETTHPVMQSAEPGENWRWCYVHHLTA
jgi:CPA1 family monovalent cation:H+ antiporter